MKPHPDIICEKERMKTVKEINERPKCQIYSPSDNRSEAVSRNSQTLQQVPEGCSNPEILEKKTKLTS